MILTETLNKGKSMKLSKEKLELEYLKAQADNINTKIDIYNDQFGPSSDVVIKLKNEVKKIDMLILDLMVEEQENSVKSAIID
jgi:hypothetical protein